MTEKIGKLCVSPECPVLDAIKVLDETHERILLIEKDGFLKGVLTDSDVRKWLIKNGDLSVAVESVMTKDPIIVTEDNLADVHSIMEKKGIDAIPLVDQDGKVVDLIFRYDTSLSRRESREKIKAPVVIMAGGKGTRLRPYTQVLPKPLIPIGETTILEQVMESFHDSGCEEFFISVNYRKNLIKAYFQDLSPSYHVEYIEEEKFLGTAGSLFLVKDRIKEPFFVSNCDILLDVDYADVMKYHQKKNNVITMITSLKNYTIPYGVVSIFEDGNVDKLEEKPEMNFLVNTGVYVLNPEVLSDIPDGVFLHITDLIQIEMDKGCKVGVYPVTEKAWEDMGEMDAMENMLRMRGIKWE